MDKLFHEITKMKIKITTAVYLILMVFLTFVPIVLSGGGIDKMPPDLAETGTAGDTEGTYYPSDYSYSNPDYPQYTPPNPAVIDGVKYKDYRGMHKDGNKARLNL